MLISNGDQSYIGCIECLCRLTPTGSVKETKAKMQSECTYKCPRCASIGREIIEQDES